MTAHDRIWRGANVLGEGQFGGPSQWDAFICALGYERRARFVAEKIAFRADKCLALAFSNHHTLEFAENRRLFEEWKFDVVEFHLETLESELHVFLEKMRQDISKDALTICVDISSMSRPMLAGIVLFFASSKIDSKFDVTFAYAPAKYSPDIRTPGPVSYAGPVLPEFAGWSTFPDAPLAGIVGLGCEDDYAMGALEQLEVSATRVFLPGGESRDYERVVREANGALLDKLGPNQIFEYNVHRPVLCYQLLDRLVHSFRQDYRPIILPFGPKIFALLSLILGCNYHPALMIWRVSGAQMSIPIDRDPSGRLVGVKVTFETHPRYLRAHEVHASAVREEDAVRLLSLD